MEILFFFEWAETSLLGSIGKTYGGVYAIAQSIHLLSLALLGGAVLVTDLRLLRVVLRDVPSETIAEGAHRWFKIGLAGILATGVFMAAAIAIRMYHNEFFAMKMMTLFVGIVFVFAVKRPLLNRRHAEIAPWVVYSVALASLAIWFTVAATGRWIGFS